MSLQDKKIKNVTSLLLALCLLCVCAGVGFAAPLSGKLTTSGQKPIMVNGNQVNSGMSIFSGAQLHSPEGVGATVELGALGRLDMAPSTEVMLTFSKGVVMAELKSGCIALTTKKGIKGIIKSTEGQMETDSSKLSSIMAPTACVASLKASAVGEAVGSGIGANGPVGAAGSSIGAGTVVGIGAAGAAVIGGAAAASRGSRGKDVSSATPHR